MGAAKLTEADVIAIRRIYAEGGITQEAVARRFGVTQMLVSKVVRRSAWRHVA